MNYKIHANYKIGKTDLKCKNRMINMKILLDPKNLMIMLTQVHFKIIHYNHISSIKKMF